MQVFDDKGTFTEWFGDALGRTGGNPDVSILLKPSNSPLLITAPYPSIVCIIGAGRR